MKYETLEKANILKDSIKKYKETVYALKHDMVKLQNKSYWGWTDLIYLDDETISTLLDYYETKLNELESELEKL